MSGFVRNQWLTASVAKTITSLLFSGEYVWSKSGFKGLFSKLKRINTQHRGPDKVEYIGHAVNPA